MATPSNLGASAWSFGKVENPSKKSTITEADVGRQCLALEDVKRAVLTRQCKRSKFQDPNAQGRKLAATKEEKRAAMKPRGIMVRWTITPCEPKAFEGSRMGRAGKRADANQPLTSQRTGATDIWRE